jgi:hypothetical protein
MKFFAGLDPLAKFFTGLWLALYCLVLLVLLTGCLGSISVKELDAQSCGSLSVEECKKLQRSENEEIKI